MPQIIIMKVMLKMLTPAMMIITMMLLLEYLQLAKNQMLTILQNKHHQLVQTQMQRNQLLLNQQTQQTQQTQKIPKINKPENNKSMYIYQPVHMGTKSSTVFFFVAFV